MKLFWHLVYRYFEQQSGARESFWGWSLASLSLFSMKSLFLLLLKFSSLGGNAEGSYLSGSLWMKTWNWEAQTLASLKTLPAVQCSCISSSPGKTVRCERAWESCSLHFPGVACVCKEGCCQESYISYGTWERPKVMILKLWADVGQKGWRKIRSESCFGGGSGCLTIGFSPFPQENCAIGMLLLSPTVGWELLGWVWSNFPLVKLQKHSWLKVEQQAQ